MPDRAHGREILVRLSWTLIDATLWAVAIVGATWMRYDYDFEEALAASTLTVAGLTAAAHMLLGWLIGPYGVGHIRGSFEEIIGVARTVIIVALALFSWALIAEPIVVPRSVPAVAGAFALFAMLSMRVVLRTYRVRRAASRDAEQRVIIYGAGIAGRRLVHNLLFDSSAGFVPVAFLDDDRSKRKLRIEGIRVRGHRGDMARVARKHGASHIVFALPNADAALLRELTVLAEQAELHAMVLPPLTQIIGGRPRSQDIRDIHLEDLLGRRPVQLDQTVISEIITNHTVLVTGAGGSIGSELGRQIARFGPSKLVLLDRDESALHATQLSMTGKALLEDEDLVLADVRDPEALHRIFAEHRPDVVFHAAALKHLSLLERYPLEAWQTNVQGTLNMLTVAAEHGVGTFVNVSTDKAASPTSVLGYSKRIAERLTADFARMQFGRYVSVRFGNVLGSRGSVVPTFATQIESGGPLTVTHPDVERYFMLIPEACQLVMQAAAIGGDGQVMVLDMGESVKIVEVAHTLLRMSDRQDIDVLFTGLRSGEKLSEVLFGVDEEPRSTAHPLVSAVSVPGLPPISVRTMHGASRHQVEGWMRLHASSAQPPLEVHA